MKQFVRPARSDPQGLLLGDGDGLPCPCSPPAWADTDTTGDWVLVGVGEADVGVGDADVGVGVGDSVVGVADGDAVDGVGDGVGRAS